MSRRRDTKRAFCASRFPCRNSNAEIGIIADKMQGEPGQTHQNKSVTEIRKGGSGALRPNKPAFSGRPFPVGLELSVHFIALVCATRRLAARAVPPFDALPCRLNLPFRPSGNLVTTVQQPSVNELRAVFEPAARQRSFTFGLFLVVLLALIFAGSVTAIVLVHHLSAKLLLSFILGLVISLMFVVGHDACHDSLTPSHALNEILGRICFLPTLHPYVSWELGHNRLHHGWTNLKGVDYVYPPYSVEEFRKLPHWRRRLEMIYRTVPGIGLFYFVEVWWKHMIFPRREDFGKLRRGRYALDLALVLTFFLAEVFIAIYPASAWTHALANLFCVILLPYAMWNWLMAFVTIQHHTHPKAPWFKNREEWSFFHGQVHGTIHVRLPRWIELLFHNILDHTAHHVDPKIPLYRLPSCQQRLEESFSEDVVVEHSSIPALSRVLRTCQLYDYENHRWLDFEGRPSAPSIPLQRWAQTSASGEAPRASQTISETQFG